MRTFRFITTGSSATEAQNQTIACNLHLEPVNDVSSTQPVDCSCHTEDDCVAAMAASGIINVWFHSITKYQLIDHIASVEKSSSNNRCCYFEYEFSLNLKKNEFPS